MKDGKINITPIETTQEEIMIRGNQIYLAPQKALTASTGFTINTGDVNTNTEITNMRTRISELETKLVALGLIRKT